MAEATIEWTHRRLPDGRLLPGYTFRDCVKSGRMKQKKKGKMEEVEL